MVITHNTILLELPALEEQGVFDMVFGFLSFASWELKCSSIIQQLEDFDKQKTMVFIHSSGLKWDNSSGLYNQLNTHLGETREDKSR